MTAALSISDLAALRAFAHALADAAGQVILPYFRRDMAIANKHDDGGFDPVTEADKRAEEKIRELIRARFPEHGVMGEEFGLETGRSPLTWVIDPIDGTRAFMCGMAQWGTLIGLNDGQRPILGVLDQPYTGERWTGWAGVAEFARVGGAPQRLASRRGVRLEDAILSTTSPVGYFTPAETQAFWALSARTRLTRFGGDCYAYGLLAHGCIDIVVESGLKPWDVQALIPIVAGAGGVMTNWQGGDCHDGGQVVACGDPALLPAVLQVLAGG